MKPLKYVVITMLASSIALAQAQNQPTPQAEKSNQNPAGAAAQADRPAGQATQSGTANARTFIGTIVNASCEQASSLTNRVSFADRSGSSSTPAEGSKNTSAADKENKSVYDLEKEVLRRCPANSSLTAFAVVTDEGNFYKLDDAGNNQVKSQAGVSDSDKRKKNLRNMRVTVTGTVQGDTLQVQSLTKSDKPFGAD